MPPDKSAQIAPEQLPQKVSGVPAHLGPDPDLPKKVVVVDDSRSVRSWLRHVIGTDARLLVVGEASDAQEARRVIKATNPDVITLDIDMPGMSGLDFLERLIRLRPLPVVMISSLTQRGSDAAIQALSIGAVDCIVKPGTMMDQAAQQDLTDRLFSAASSQVSGAASLSSARAPGPPPNTSKSKHVVLIGASTGGVAALETVLGGLDPAGPPVVIAQHMPAPFLMSFAERLNNMLAQDVALLRPGMPLCPGQVRLAPGGATHGTLRQKAGGWQADTLPRSAQDLYCPSVDTLFQSAVHGAHQVTAALLTGLGKDGAKGLLALHDAGAHTIGQDSGSCVVYGMPKAAFDAGAVREQLPLKDIADAINHSAKAISRQQGSH